MADWMTGADGLNYYDNQPPPPGVEMPPEGAGPMPGSSASNDGPMQPMGQTDAPSEFSMVPGEAGQWMLNGGVTGMGGQDVMSQLRGWYSPAGPAPGPMGDPGSVVAGPPATVNAPPLPAASPGRAMRRFSGQPFAPSATNLGTLGQVR